MDKTTEDATEERARLLGMDSVPGALRAPLGKYQKYRRNFYVVIAAVVVGFLLNSVAGDLYHRYKPWKTSDDEFVQKIAEDQKAEFENLRTSLADIRSNLPADSKDALASIQQTLANVERGSAGLVQQLDLAKREIETVRAVSVNRGGVGGGYDFTLAEHDSMDLAPGALIGLTAVAPSFVHVTLTSGGATTNRNKSLRAGEALTYAGSGGRDCWVALRSIQDGKPGAASFNTGCS